MSGGTDMATWKTPGRRLRKLRELSPSDRRTLAEATLWLPIMGAGLRILGFNRMQALLARRLRLGASRRVAGRESAVEARAVARAVKTAIRHGPYRATCLPESLVLWSLLRRRGHPAELHIGTRTDRYRFEAHAWVQIRDVVINDAHDVQERFASFKRDILDVRKAEW